MFFQTTGITAEILSVIDMEWERVHAHAGFRPFHTLSLRVIGGATFFFDDKDSFHVEEGEITFVPARYDFGKDAGQGRILAVHFSSATPLPFEILHFKPKNFSFFKTAFLDLYRVWNRKESGYDHEAKMIFYRILLAIEREWEEKNPSLRNEKLSDACRYIHKHFSDSTLTVAALAQMSAMSETYFRRLFIAEFNQPPLKYINHLRLTLAQELLRTDYYTVQEVAERSGFNNIHYFCSFFKKKTGYSPLAYKKSLILSSSLS